jgi:glycosyltransferase involved in cell wall biosynthesis
LSFAFEKLSTGNRYFSQVSVNTPVWVIVDGSTDGSAERLLATAAGEPGLRVFVLSKNRGKGAAVLHGLREASARGSRMP